MDNQELDARLAQQARRCYRLHAVLEALRTHPESERDTMRLALLEFSKHSMVMERVANRILALTSNLPVPLTTIVDSVRREVEGE